MSITVTIPEIDAAVVASLETETQLLAATEAEAIEALRRKFAPLAKHAGYVKVADLTNQYRDVEHHYSVAGKKIHALLCDDSFRAPNSDQNTGTYRGSRLYLLESGEWLRIRRVGEWSQWQGSTDWWDCDGSLAGDDSGDVTVMTSAEVATTYKLADIVAEMSESLAEMAQKLPERLTRIRQRASLASQLLETLR